MRNSSLTVGRCDNLVDLGDQGLVDELAQVDLANALDEAEVQPAEVQLGEVDVAEDALLLDRQEGGQLLQLEQGVEVEVLGGEEALERGEVEVVDLAELAKVLEVEVVEGEEVVEVEVLEALEVVQEVQVNVGAGLVGSGGWRGSGGVDEGGEGREDDG